MTGPRQLSIATMTIVIAVLVALLGCSGAGSQLADTGGMSAAPPISLLPQIPAGVFPTRKFSVAQPNTINGATFFQKSAGAAVSGAALQLNSGAGSIEWGIYEFPTAGAPLISLNVDVTVQSGGPVWLGLANYTKHVWEFAGPYTPGSDVALSTNNVSPGGSLFFVVVAYNGTQLLQNSATVVVDAAPSTTIDMPSGFPDMFNPTTANLDPGTEITFTNSDSAPHTVTVDPLNAAPGGPSSPTISAGGNYVWTVPSDAVSGTKWFYHCAFHGLAGDGSSLGSGMAGVIIVN